MYPYLLCNVDVMISTLQKRLQDALLSLVGPSSSFRIGSHLGRDKNIAYDQKIMKSFDCDLDIGIFACAIAIFCP